MKRVAYYVWIVILGLLVLMGLYNFYVQSVEGFHVTNLREWVPWGLYIASYVFFIGASAGATIVGLMIHAFGRQDYKPIGTQAILIGLLCLMAAILFLMADLSNLPALLRRPWRILANPTSLFRYLVLVYLLFGLIQLAELYYATKITRGVATDRHHKMAKWLAIIAVPFALWAVHALTGTAFSVVKAREYWNTPLLPPHFAIAALVTGTAIIILVTIVSSKATGKKIVSEETLAHMGKLLAFFLAVTLFFDFFDILVLNYGETPEGVGVWSLLTSRYAPLFVLNVGGLVVALLILLFKGGRTVPGLLVASVLTIAAVAAYRYNLTVVGLLVPLSPEAFRLYRGLSYSPTIVELSIAAGIVALVMFLYTVLTKVVPLEEAVSEA